MLLLFFTLASVIPVREPESRGDKDVRGGLSGRPGAETRPFFPSTALYLFLLCALWNLNKPGFVDRMLNQNEGFRINYKE